MKKRNLFVILFSVLTMTLGAQTEEKINTQISLSDEDVELFKEKSQEKPKKSSFGFLVKGCIHYEAHFFVGGKNKHFLRSQYLNVGLCVYVSHRYKKMHFLQICNLELTLLASIYLV